MSNPELLKEFDRLNKEIDAHNQKKQDKIKAAIKLLQENGYVVNTKESFKAAQNNWRNKKAVITDKHGTIIGLQG